MSFSDIISSIKYRLLVDRVYLYISLALIFVLILSVILFFILRPKQSTLPPLPGGSLNSGLVAYWGFEEEEGQLALDATGRGNFGRFGSSNNQDSSDPKREKKGKKGRAVLFDGKDDYIVVFQNNFINNIRDGLTLEGWFKVQGPAVPSSPPVWLEGFKYRRQIIIDNTKSGENFENFQILVFLNTKELIDAGKMLSDCQDLRVTDEDETTLLNYWIETGCNTQETRVWIKVPLAKARSFKVIYLYYGNPEAQDQSNYYQTMEVPPVVWFQYKKDEREGAFLRALGIDHKGNIIMAGSDTRERNLQFRVDFISELGVRVNKYQDNPSGGSDVVEAVASDKTGTLVLAGFDELAGNSQWRAVRTWPYPFWIFTQNYSPGSDEIRALAIDSEGNVILGGYDSIPKDAQWRIVKLNTFGQLLWERTINPSPGADMIVDLKVDSRNNVIVAGIDKTLGNDRWHIEKFDPNGKFLSGYRLDISDGADVLNAISLDSKDNVIAVGYDFYYGDAQWRIVKIDSDLKGRIWQWTFNPSPDFDELTDVTVDSLDNIIVGGYDMKEGNARWVVMKFNSKGQKLWEWTFNPSKGNDIVKEILVDSDNNIIVGGSDFSLRNDPEWSILKISERIQVSPWPTISLETEKRVESLGENIIVIKPGSWQISAISNQILGLINQNPILSSNLVPEKWNHFAMTYDQNRQTLYLNGELVTTRALSGKIETNFNNLFIGYNFSGLIDELKIYNRALLAQEVKSLYLLGQE